MKKYFQKIWAAADELNRKNILQFMRTIKKNDTDVMLLDLGCDDGCWTVEIAHSLGANKVVGVEIVPEQLEKAKQKGIQICACNLNEQLPLESKSFDVIHANQVIEHVAEIDLFISEVFRLLKPGGHAVISTENGSSWHNIFAAIMGWQIFSLTNISYRVAGLGNPLAIHRGANFTESWAKSWTHKTIFNYQGLIEIFQIHGFRNVEIVGAGYYPLPAVVGSWDVRHSHFITVKVQK